MLSQDNRSDAGDEGRFRLAMASSGIGMAIVDLEGRWVDVNPAFERMFGHAAADVVGRQVDEFTHPDDIQLSHAFLSGLVDGSIEALDGETRYLHRDGATLWTHVNAAAMRDDEHRPLYLIVQLRDVTAQHEAEAALQTLNESLETRAAARTASLEAMTRQSEQLAYGISHDLRSPLRAIDSFAALLASQSSDALDDTGRDYLDRIRAAASRMAKLIDSLLDLSRASRAELRFQPVDISLLADWSYAELHDAEPQRDAAFTVQAGLVALGDERQLKLLFDQLLQNAWKFTEDDQRIDIDIRGKRDGERIVLEIRDRGIGFDMRYADKLFEPFQRLHGPEQAGGNGIGLAIAQRIVERHGGRMWAQSDPGAGSTFHVELPAVPDTES